MKKINLITCNEHKMKEYKILLEPEFKVNVIRIDYPELRSDNVAEIAALAAKQIAGKLKKVVVLEDAGFFIRALKGFPGTSTAYIFKRIGNKGILQLMKGVKDRKCWYRVAVAYCAPEKEPKIFVGEDEGRVSLKEKGKSGWGCDPIFIPKGKNKTYGELKGKEDVDMFRKKAVSKLAQFLRKNESL